MQLASKAVQAVLGLSAAAFTVFQVSAAQAATTTTEFESDVAGLPVLVCFQAECQLSPALIEAEASVTVETPGFIVPTITTSACPAGFDGVVLSITTTSPTEAVVSGTFDGITTSNDPYSNDRAATNVTLSSTPVTFSACADLTP